MAISVRLNLSISWLLLVSAYKRSDHVSRVNLCDTGEKLSDTEIDEMIHDADIDGDGQISLEGLCGCTTVKDI